jgi:hypothetical protein
MHAFGVKTTLITRNKYLNQVDRDVIDVLKDSMKKLGLD